ncbi:D-aspartate oxidase isoform X3 [Columba livia]|uniref:D-aspartate oxidase isoform X3 n=1 Tax=Columba livia TaxID=8932 RepID=UPI0031BB04C9
MAAPKVAVIGAGVVGLSTALCIVETCPSCSVTVLSDQFSPNTTSNVAAGILIPHTYPGTPIHVQKQWFKETFTYLFALSNSNEASEAGVHLVSGWQIFKNTPTPKEELPFWSDVVLGFRPMSEAELQKFPQHQFGQAFTTLKCECPPYLLWLEKSRCSAGPSAGVSPSLHQCHRLHPGGSCSHLALDINPSTAQSSCFCFALWER